MPRFFRFDVIELGPELLPLAARRALDAAGLRLGRAGWASLGQVGWSTLAELGSAAAVDAPSVERCVAAAEPPAVPTEPVAEPPPHRPPPEVRVRHQRYVCPQVREVETDHLHANRIEHAF